jgi:SAM-dependent methyltransferase
VTSQIAAEGPNAEQIEYWNSTQGSRWVDNQDRLDSLIEPFGELVLERAGISAGARAIDVGCGCGATCLALARRVGPGGSVLGIDISAVMLDRARERARAAGAQQIELANVDAQTHRFEPRSRDLVFSRFGVMFFADPTAAFANLRAALRPGGGVAFVCWRPLGENPWMTVPFAAVATVLAPPPPPPPDAPGPFAFGDAQRVRKILGDAGFERIEIAPHEREISLGASPEQATDFSLAAGPASRLLVSASERDRSRAAAAVREALVPHARGGRVALGSATWLVTARNPA